MARKRSRYSSKRSRRSFKRRRTVKSYRRRWRQSSKTPYIKFRRFCQDSDYIGQDITGPGSVENWKGFQFNQIPAFDELAYLFDRYKITGVKYRWVLKQDPAAQSVTQAYRGQSVQIKWVKDYDDSSTYSDDALKQYPNFRDIWLTSDRQCSRWYFFKPAVLNISYEGTANNAFSPKWNQWIDMASTTVPHYGIKWNYSGLYAGAKLVFEYYIYCQCRGMR